MKIKYLLLFAFIFFGLIYAESIGYTGQSFETDTVYLRLRYYDPETGTFFSKDPLGINASLNSYCYVESNATNKTDRMGLWAGIDDAIALGGGAAAGVVGQGIADLIQGKTSSWQDYTASALGGAAAGETLLYTANPFAAGAAAGVTSNLSRQGLNAMSGAGSNFDLGGLITETALSSLLSGVGGTVSNKLSPLIQDGLQSLSNKTKGAIGEALTTVTLPLRGIIPTGFQVEQSIANTGKTTYVDVTGKSIFNLSEDLFFESKWGSSSLTSNQKAFQSLNSSSYIVDRWNVPEIATQTVNTFAASASSSLSSLFNLGGVLIDKAATLIGSNLSDIKGATYDPVTKQLVFLGTNDASAVKDIDLDYFYTAVNAVYGSAVPPFVTLDPPVSLYTQWTDYGDGDGTFEPGEWGGVYIRYNPIWTEEDGTIDLKVTLKSSSQIQENTFFTAEAAEVRRDFSLQISQIFADQNRDRFVLGRNSNHEISHSQEEVLGDGLSHGFRLAHDPISTVYPFVDLLASCFLSGMLCVRQVWRVTFRKFAEDLMKENSYKLLASSFACGYHELEMVRG